MSLCMSDTAPRFKRRISSLGDILLEENRIGYCHSKQLQVTRRMTRIHQPWNTATGESRGNIRVSMDTFEDVHGCPGTERTVTFPVSVLSVNRHKIWSDHVFRVHEQQAPMIPPFALVTESFIPALASSRQCAGALPILRSRIDLEERSCRVLDGGPRIIPAAKSWYCSHKATYVEV